MGCSSSQQKPANLLVGGTVWEKPPYWVDTVVVPSDGSTQDDCFGPMSSGCQMTAANQVVRQKFDKFCGDGAMWNRPLLKGKHVFEICFPKDKRGANGSVGVGLAGADLMVKGRTTLVGNDDMSWGFNMTSRRAEHGTKNTGQDNMKQLNTGSYGKTKTEIGGHIIKKYPVNMAYFPDVFLMYVDADSGTLMFASNDGYYGTAWDGLPRDKPLYVMVGMTETGASCTITYKGQAQIGGPPPAPPAALPPPGAPANLYPALAPNPEATPGPAAY